MVVVWLLYSMGLAASNYFAGMPLTLKETKISNSIIGEKRSQLAGGRPVGYLKAWFGI